MSFPRRTVELAGGQLVDVLEFGDPVGVPALYLHGTPSSGSEAHWLHAPALRHGVRVVSLDRPGYLATSPVAVGFDVVARTCTELASILGLDRFAVMGFSGGAGYALATAHAAGAATPVVHVGGGMASIAGEASGDLTRGRRAILGFAARAPAVASRLVQLQGRQVRRQLEQKLQLPILAALELFEGASKGAQYAAAEAYVRASSSEELRWVIEDYCRGSRATPAILGDITAISRPWPFALGELDTPVELWHGTADSAAPLAYARRLARELPNATLHTLDGEGHFVFLSHGEEACASIRAALA